MMRAGPTAQRWRCQAGQATVELVALLPVLIAVALSVFCVLAAGRARELAAHAAGSGAVALLQDADPEQAAWDAIPGHTAREAQVTVRDRTVTVTIRPRLPLPGLAKRLAATERAHAGASGP